MGPGNITSPDLPVLNLSEASVVVFLSLIFAGTQCIDGEGRAVGEFPSVGARRRDGRGSSDTDDARFRTHVHDISKCKIHRRMMSVVDRRCIEMRCKTARALDLRRSAVQPPSVHQSILLDYVLKTKRCRL